MGRVRVVAVAWTVGLVLAGCQGSPTRVAGARANAPAPAPARAPVRPAVVAPPATTAGCADHGSAVVASLPGVGTAAVGGEPLPAGRPVAGGAAWVTDAPVPDSAVVWAALVERYPSTGLWPVLLTGSPEWRGAVVGPGGVAPAAALAQAWERTLPAGIDRDDTVRELLWPFRRAPVGVGPGVVTCTGPLVETVAAAHDLRLALLAVARPAEVVGHLAGAADATVTMSLLRSWEDRFGAFVVAVGDQGVQLGVERPPPLVDDAYRLAAELFAVDPTVVTDEFASIGALAAELPNRRTWLLAT